jgi:hypothetical protein
VSESRIIAEMGDSDANGGSSNKSINLREIDFHFNSSNYKFELEPLTFLFFILNFESYFI